MSCVDRAVIKCKKITNYHISPFRCYYFNPRKYSSVQLLKWAQKYMVNRMYNVLLQAGKINGFEVVPGELLMSHAARMGVDGKRIKLGNLSFYILKKDEMSKKLLERYLLFQKEMAYQNSNSNYYGMSK